jgi:hypothetical protein
MTGFIRGLFSRKDSDQPEEPQGAFFLDDDSAKSMGDVEYMRSVKATRRTFPVSVDQPEHIEIIQSVSAMGKSVSDNRKGYVAPQGAAQSTANFSSGSATSFSSPASSGFGNSSFGSSSFASSSAPAPAAEPTVEPRVESAPRRKTADGGMDMFRSMAKDIRK